MATQVSASRAVFDQHIDALRRGDLDVLMTHFTDDSTLIGPDGVTKGVPGIRAVYNFFLTGLLKPGTFEIDLDKVHVDGDVVYVLWHARCNGADVSFAADTFVIHDGKITVQTFAPKVEPHA